MIPIPDFVDYFVWDAVVCEFFKDLFRGIFTIEYHNHTKLKSWYIRLMNSKTYLYKCTTKLHNKKEKKIANNQKGLTKKLVKITYLNNPLDALCHLGSRLFRPNRHDCIDVCIHSAGLGNHRNFCLTFYRLFHLIANSNKLYTNKHYHLTIIVNT